MKSNEAGEGDYDRPKEQMTYNLLGTDVVRRCVERDKAGEWVDCGQPREQVYLPDNSRNIWKTAGMAEKSSIYGILTANRAENISVPGELTADMVEKSSVRGIQNFVS